MLLNSASHLRTVAFFISSQLVTGAPVNLPFHSAVTTTEINDTRCCQLSWEEIRERNLERKCVQCRMIWELLCLSVCQVWLGKRFICDSYGTFCWQNYCIEYVHTLIIDRVTYVKGVNSKLECKMQIVPSAFAVGSFFLVKNPLFCVFEQSFIVIDVSIQKTKSIDDMKIGFFLKNSNGVENFIEKFIHWFYRKCWFWFH